MPEGVAETTIARSADEVWALIGDFGDVSWVPNNESCTVVDDVRYIRMVGVDVSVNERLLDEDDEARSHTYCLAGELDLQSILGPGAVVSERDLVATLKVTPTGETTSHVTWELVAPDVMFKGAFEEYQAALDSAKARLEG
jgi:hypothetical protein